MIKILFICHGNICRSPMAEYVFRDMVQKTQQEDQPGHRPFPQFTIASAATSTEEIGNPVHRGTKGILKRHGIDCSQKRARQMTWRDYGEYDYLIGMDQWNLLNMKRITNGDPEGKIFRLLDFTDSPGDIADPWYTGDFDATYADVIRGSRGLLEHIIKSHR